MSDKRETDERRPTAEAEPGEDEIRVEDRRHWLRDDDADGDDEPHDGETVEPRRPTVVDEYRERAEAAEEKLQEYIAAYKASQSEQDAFRERLARDVDRRVSLQFGELIGDLLGSVDDLDLALAHADGASDSGGLADGVRLVRDRFLATLQKHGVSRIEPTGEPFDPNESEALRVDPVDDDSRHDVVTETLQPGYRLGEQVVRPARVAVGRRG